MNQSPNQEHLDGVVDPQAGDQGVPEDPPGQFPGEGREPRYPDQRESGADKGIGG